MPASPKKAGYAQVSVSDDAEQEAVGLLPSYDESNFLMQQTWGWMWPVVKLGNRKQLDVTDLRPLP